VIRGEPWQRGSRKEEKKSVSAGRGRVPLPKELELYRGGCNPLGLRKGDDNKEDVNEREMRDGVSSRRKRISNPGGHHTEDCSSGEVCHKSRLSLKATLSSDKQSGERRRERGYEGG